MVTTVAPTIPVEAASNMPTITTPIPSPPLVDPKSSPIDCNSPAAILVFSSIIPIKINKGTATKGSLIIVPNILWGKNPIILKLNTSRASPRNPNIRAEPARVKATGKPKSNNPKVVKNIIMDRISGVIICFYFLKLKEMSY